MLINLINLKFAFLSQFLPKEIKLIIADSRFLINLFIIFLFIFILLTTYFSLKFLVNL